MTEKWCLSRAIPDGRAGKRHPVPAPDQIAALHERLLAWWDAGHRDLPWRRTTDPYAILVSEVMLQQTQVSRVVPKFEAFMARFPTLAALADVPVAV